MADRTPTSPAGGQRYEIPEIDRTKAHPARVYEWFLGGKNNFQVDRDAAVHMASALPGGVDAVKLIARVNRDFLVRAVRRLAEDAGIRQFIDLGSGIPTSNDDNVHQVAQAVDPTCRVLYVDYDPVVLAMAHQILQKQEVGRTDFILVDVRDSEKVLSEATILDTNQPVALLAVAVFHIVPDDPAPIVAKYLEGLPSGSFVALSHMAADIDGENTMEMARRYTEMAKEPMVPRTKQELERILDGLELVEPGIVPAVEWKNPDRNPDDPVPPIYGALARKP